MKTLRRAAALLVLACAALGSWCGQAWAAPVGYHLAFNEEFSGNSINDTKFRYWLTDGVECATDAVSVSNGIMTLTPYTTGVGEGMQHHGGSVGTQGMYSFTYGYVEARVKFVNSPGIDMAHCLYSEAMFTSPPGSAADGMEIDIIEQRQTDGDGNNIHDMAKVTLHAGGYGDEHYQHGADPNVNGLANNWPDTSSGWHTIGLVWNNDGYSFFVDPDANYSNPIWTYHPDWWDDLLNGELRSHNPEFLNFAAAMGPAPYFAGPAPEGGYGSLETSTTKMYVDYCRIYQPRSMSWNNGGGSGTWNAANENWGFTDQAVFTTFADHDDVYFRGAGGTVTIANGFTPQVRSMQFEADGYTITGSSFTLTTDNISVGPGNTATINSSIGGGHGIILKGEGKLILGGNNTYTDITVVSAMTNTTWGSTLNIRHANALGDTEYGTIVRNGGTLEIQDGITIAELLNLSGMGVNYNGALRNVSGNNTLNGTIWLGGDNVRIVSNSGTLTLNGTIYNDPSGGEYNLYLSADSSIVVNGVIDTESGGIIVDLAGTVTLNNANTYTGMTTLNAGTLVYGVANAFSNSSSLTVNGGTLPMGTYSDTFNTVTVAGGSITGTGTLSATNGFTVSGGTVGPVLGGTGGLTKIGAGTFTLSRANTYLGATTVQEGTLAYGVANAINTGDVTISGGTLSMGAYSDTVGAVNLYSGSITGTGTLFSTGGFTVRSGAVNVVLDGNVGLTKEHPYTVTLTNSNAYTGATAINQGTLIIQSNNALGTVAGGATVASGATLAIQGGINYSTAEPLTISGVGVDSGGALRNISGNNTYAGLVTLGSSYTHIDSDSGTLTLSNAGTITGNGYYSLFIGGAGNVTIGSVIGTGTGALAKDGAGTLTLNRANTYTGVTTVNAGTLAYGIANAISSGPVTVNGGTLNIGAYSDTVGTVTLSGGTITGTTGVLTGSSYAVQSGTVSAILDGAGALTKTGAGTVALTKANTYTGATTVSAGALNVQSNNALGTNAAGTTVASGAELHIQGGINYSTAEALTLNGTGVSNTGALRNVSGNNSYAGLVTLGSTSRISSDSGTLTLSSAGTITGSGSLFFGGAGNVTIGSVIGTGAGALTKDGAGTVTLNRANTYIGPTTVSAGTLAYGIANAISSGMVIVSGGTLNIGAYNDTVGTVSLYGGTITGTTGVLTGASYDVQSGTASAILGGAGALTKSGAGTVALTKANAYTGATTVSFGALNIQSNNALGTNAAGTTVASGAELQIQGGINYSTAEALTLNGTGVSNTGALRNVSGNNSYAGLVTLGSSGVRINCDSGQLNLNNAGTITGSRRNLIFGGAGDIGVNSHIGTNGGSVTKDGGGTLALLSSSTYTGATYINAGSVVVQNSSAFGTSAGGVTVASGASVRMQNTGTYADAFTLSGTGVGNNGALRNIAGNSTVSGAITLAGAARINSDSGTLTLAGNIGGSGRNLTVGGAGNTTISSVIGTGGGTLTKDGTGTLLLTGNNTYTGLTAVAGGTLELGQNAQSRILSAGGCDIQQGRIIFDYPDQWTTIQPLLATSYNDGEWDTGKFLCTTADFNRGLGWVDNGSNVTVRYALYGDLDLDGTVTVAELSLIGMNVGTPTSFWSDGDLDYDGWVTWDDWDLADMNVGQYQSMMIPIDKVPEPSTLVLLACGLLGLLAYAWKKRK